MGFLRLFGFGDGNIFMGIHPSEDATRKNLVAYAFTTWSTVSCFVFVNAAQPSVLRNILPPGNVDNYHGGGGMAGAGNASGTITFWAELTVIIVSPLWGALADKVGGRTVNWCGFGIVAAGLAIIPNTLSIEALTLARCLFSVGAAALGSTLASLLADTVMQHDKGKGAALAGVCSSFGAVFAALVMLRIPAMVENMARAGTLHPGTAIRCAYYTASCLALAAAGVGAAFLFQDVKSQVIGTQSSANWTLASAVSRVHASLLDRSRQCIWLLRRDAGLLLALSASVQARGDASTVTVFLSLWVNEYSRNKLGMSSAGAAQAAGKATGIVYMLSLVGGPVWGIVCDKLGDVKALLLASCLSGITYTSLFFVEDPSSGMGSLIGAGIGVAEIAMVVSAQSMLSRRSPPGSRGLLGGMSSLCSGVGILFAGKVGGIAYDVSPGGPFLVQGILSFALMAACAALSSLGMVKDVEVAWTDDGGPGKSNVAMAGLDSLQVEVSEEQGAAGEEQGAAGEEQGAAGEEQGAAGEEQGAAGDGACASAEGTQDDRAAHFAEGAQEVPSSGCHVQQGCP